MRYKDENGTWKEIPIKVTDAFLDMFYPVGSYYETSDTNFNPNTVWGGTWIEDSKGRVTVGLDSTQTEFNTIGKIDGEKSHTLTTNEIPHHNHIGLKIISGESDIPITAWSDAYIKPNFNMNDLYNTTGGTNNVFSTGYSGGDQSHNNLQPYIVVKRWHRTA